MSQATIRKLLESHLATAPGDALPTAWENIAFKPEAGTAWQRVNTLHGQTQNPTMGDDFKREVGLFQISLCYPENKAAKAAIAKADLLCGHFKRGTTFTQDNVRLMVPSSPYISGVIPDGGWFRVAVSVPYVADVNPN